jgi:molecular chaperone GrpE
MTLFKFKKPRVKTMTEQNVDEKIDELTEDTADITENDSGQTDLLAEVNSWKDKTLRLAAEMDNLRKRAERDREDALKYGVSNAARLFLTVADNLERAIASLPGDRSELADPVSNLVSGVEATQKDLMNALSKLGVTPIPVTIGDQLDPQIHEVMFDAPSDNQPPNTVLYVLETGYKLHERLLRPARIAVTKAGGASADNKTVDVSA